MLCKVKLNKTLAFNALRFVLTVIFLYYFITGIQKLIRNEIGTKITIDDEEKSVLPSFNICPYYTDNKKAIDMTDNYTVEDVEKLPSLLEVLDAQLEIYGQNKPMYVLYLLGIHLSWGLPALGLACLGLGLTGVQP